MGREVIGTASVGQDAYNHGFREGKAEAEAKFIENVASSVLNLVNAEGWSLEKALSLLTIPEYIRDEVEKSVREKMN